VSEFGGVTQENRNGLAKLVLQLDGQLGSLGLRHDQVGGGGGLGHGVL
jgi:hypothetical protein